MKRRQALTGWAFLLCLAVSPTLAYMLPGDFILRRVEDQWKDSPGLALQRQIIGKDPLARSSALADMEVQVRPDGDGGIALTRTMEQVYLRGGNVRVEAPALTWFYPDGPGRTATEGTTGGSSHRPGVIDAIFLRPPGQLKDLLETLGIATDEVTLDKLPTPDVPLPFRVVYRIGATGRPTMPQIQIEKDHWYVKRLQFRETARGPFWLAEYEGQGELPDLPSWLPTRIQVYRDGERFETIKVLRRLNTPVRESLFTPRPSSRKP